MAEADSTTQTSSTAGNAAGGSTSSTTNSTTQQTGAADKSTTTTDATLLGGAQAADKTTDAKPKEGEAKDAKQADAAKFELKLPEGFDEKDPLVAGFKDVATKAGLKSEQAQAVFDMYEGHIAAAAQEAAAQRVAQAKEWQAAVRADKDIGGEKLEANLRAANAAIEKFGGPELGQALKDSGLGNHPAVVKAFVKMARALSEDTVSGTNNGSASHAKGDDAVLRELFPNSPSLFGDRTA